MSFKVKIADIELNKCIDSVIFKLDTPNDSNARSTDVGNEMHICGRTGTEDKTVGLYKWSLLPANDSNAYKNVEVTIIGTNNQTVRTVAFPNAFVVDYFESYSSTNGVGNFNIFIKQKKDKDVAITVDGDMGASEDSATGAGIGEDSNEFSSAIEGLASEVGLPSSIGSVAAKEIGGMATKAGIPTSIDGLAAKVGIPTSIGAIASKNGIPTSLGELASKTGIPTSVGDLASKVGLPKEVGDLASKVGIPTSLDGVASKVGVPTSLDDLASKNGIPTSVDDLASKNGIPTSAGDIIPKKDSNQRKDFTKF